MRPRPTVGVAAIPPITFMEGPITLMEGDIAAPADGRRCGRRCQVQPIMLMEGPITLIDGDMRPRPTIGVGA